MEDLRRISGSLRDTIKHAHHGRIEYPWQQQAREAEAAAVASDRLPAPRLDSLAGLAVSATMPIAMPTKIPTSPITAQIAVALASTRPVDDVAASRPSLRGAAEPTRRQSPGEIQALHVNGSAGHDDDGALAVRATAEQVIDAEDIESEIVLRPATAGPA